MVKESKAKAATMSHHHNVRGTAYMRHFTIVVFHYWSTFVLKDASIVASKTTNNVTNVKVIHFQSSTYSLVMQDNE